MSSVTVTIQGDDQRLLNRLQQLRAADRKSALRAIAEGLRTSTIERFGREEDPNGNKWDPSVRARETSGKTLTKTGMLKSSIRSEVSGDGLAVGTNDIRAATHQFGDERTIRARNAKVLRFRIGGQWISKAEIRIKIPARPYLGISTNDESDIKNMVEAMFEE